MSITNVSIVLFRSHPGVNVATFVAAGLGVFTCVDRALKPL